MCVYCAIAARVEDTTSYLPHTASCGADTLVIVTCVLVARHLTYSRIVPPVHSLSKAMIWSIPYVPDAMRD